MKSPDSVSDESVWTDTNDLQLGPYQLAKTLTERAAWDFLAKQAGQTILTIILPAAVAGPALSKDNLHSAQLSQRMLNESLPGFHTSGSVSSISAT